MEKRAAINSATAKANSSCGLCDTKYGAITEMRTQPGAAYIISFEQGLNIRLRRAT